MSIRTSHAHGSLISDDLCSDHCDSFALSGIYLPRHDATPWLIFGEAKFAKSTTRSRRKEPDIVRNFHQRTGDDIQSTVCFDKSVMRSKGLKLDRFLAYCWKIHVTVLTLFGAVLKSKPVIFDISTATLTSKPFFVLRPCNLDYAKCSEVYAASTHSANGSSSLSKATQTREDIFDSFNTIGNLLNVSAEFLPKCERSGILRKRMS
jgi:hypothetical protein